VGKKKVRKKVSKLSYGLFTDYKVFIFQAGLLTYGSLSGCTFPFPTALPAWQQWHTAAIVPAYSAGPTLRIYTAFPFSPPLKMTPESYFLHLK
jgi:hypothetical protein